MLFIIEEIVILWCKQMAALIVSQYSLRYRIRIWIKVAYYYMVSFNCCKKARFLTAKETKSIVLKNKKSVIRLGDGEFNILNGQHVHYQKYSDELRDNLNCVINQYLESPNSSNYILCMPGEFLSCNGLSLFPRRVYIASWSFSRYAFKRYYDREIIYGDAFVFAKEHENIYKEIWLDTAIENVIFVHNQEIYARNFESKFKIHTRFVPIPSKDAFECRDQILQNVLSLIDNPDKTLVLISAGPCAKYLVFKLADQNIWAIDAGHCWDEPLHLRNRD